MKLCCGKGIARIVVETVWEIIVVKAQLDSKMVQQEVGYAGPTVACESVNCGLSFVTVNGKVKTEPGLSKIC